MYFVSRRSLNSSRKSEFGDSGHRRTPTGDLSKITADRLLSKMRQYAIDPLPPVARKRSGRSQTSLNDQMGRIGRNRERF
jgi:hypothetical protein